MTRNLCLLMTSCLTASLCACGGADEDTNAIEEAAAIAALEVNEDGANEEAGDAIDEEPFLLQGCGLGLVRQHLMTTFDENGDGELEAGERGMLEGRFGRGLALGRFRHHALARAFRFGWLREIYDADASGELDEFERATLRADLEARCRNQTEALLAEFDADGNGELSREEWQAAHAAIRESFAAHRAAVLAEFDADGDGVLSPEERVAARMAIVERLQAKREALLAEFDADGDGVLDDEERAMLIEALRAVIRGEISLADL